MSESFQPFKAFDKWREQARSYLEQGISPDQIYWNQKQQIGLFETQVANVHSIEEKTKILIPKEFISLAKVISCHSLPERWALLYEVAWRLSHGERHLLKITIDPVIHQLHLMEKAVRRDAHKAKAFIRFRRTEDEEGEIYIAWHRPDHNVLPIIAPFFQRRFSVMRWMIVTSDVAVYWNKETLVWGPGMQQDEISLEDNFESMWQTYYRAIFNPARIKLKAMRREMPVRYWDTMPETNIIPKLLAEAPSRVEEMISHAQGFDYSAANFLPDDQSLPSLRIAADGCRGCALYENATCTVFGAGPEDAKLMLVGEQPGDEEDKTGQPFIGPAGQLLDKALADAGIERSNLYITNAVKHFKYEQRGKIRIHKKPGFTEISACRPWLHAEIGTVKPKAIISLGVTAGISLLDATFTLKATHGRWHQGNEHIPIRPSYHPAAILRTPDKALKEQLYKMLVEDLIEANIKARELE